MPDEFISEGIVNGFRDKDIVNKRVLLARAAVVRPELAIGLSNLGAYVDEVPLYNTVTDTDVDSMGRKMLVDGEIDVTTFTSSSTVNNLASALNNDIRYVNDTTIACIGPVTAAAAADLDLQVDIVAEEHTIPGLVKSIIEHFERDRKV
jgi:uroporphyrinogen-III synthase